MREEQRNTAQSNAVEERIFVAIRVRPLSERERTRHDVSEWECISDNTIRFKNNGHAEQRSLSMDSYTFDRVFGERCPTQQVYEEGIKEVALSVVSGINSSIFAYGQTSSGKTYTMTGITEYAVKDIYEYIEKHKEREFVVKFSAMEIYNEAVRDLLNANATSLRLLDDPEKGTVVEKLTEETLTERNQLQQLLSICAAERTTEETAMNETSSRSHQILRLTVESNPSDYVRTARSGALTASVNFVDLAGSERASQTLSAGTRLREGSHINRSLLTLGTVIRKLSKGRNEHIPYRDSKLTRILHNSLGGNARTAIICTISPARSQVELSKNTLSFAGCAKQVTTDARVNVVMSDKVLVKQLQKELARMENELRSVNAVILKERELQIEQMDKEIKELTRQRDLFQSHVENLVQSVGRDRLSKVDEDKTSESSGVANNVRPGTDSTSENLDRTTSSLSISNEHLLQQLENLDRTTSSLSISNEHLSQQPENSEDYFLLDGCPPTFVGPDPCQGWEEIATSAESGDNCKEVPCIEIEEVETDLKTDVDKSIPDFEEKGGNSPMIQVVNVDAKPSSGNGHGDLDAPIPALEEKERNSPLIQVVNVDAKSSSGNGHSDQDALIPALEEKEGNSPMIQVVNMDAKSSPGNGHSDQDAIIPAVEEKGGNSPMIQVVNVDAKSSSGNGHSDQDAIIPASEEKGGNSPMIQVVNVDAKSSSGNGHGDLDALQQKTQDIQRTDDLLVDLSEKSNGSSKSGPHILAAMSPSRLDKVDQETSSHPRFIESEQNVSPSRINKLDQESALPLQFDELELKTTSPPPLDELEKVSVTLPARVKSGNSTSLVSFREKLSEPKLHAKKSSGKYSLLNEMDASVEDVESILDSDTEETASVLNFVVRMNERAKAKPLNRDFDDLTVHARKSGINKRVNRVKGDSFHGISGALMPSKFERQQRDIIELWDACNVPLVHRSYFFLLIKGELSDSVYLDVELRRLTFLKDTFSSGTYITEEGLDITPNSSLMSLNRERKMLSKQVHKKFSRKEREELYLKWGIDLKTKHRSIQLAWLLWTNTKDLNHARESAALVAKLVGFINTSETPKKSFGLGFLARRKSSKSHNWKDTMSTLF